MSRSYILAVVVGFGLLLGACGSSTSNTARSVPSAAPVAQASNQVAFERTGSIEVLAGPEGACTPGTYYREGNRIIECTGSVQRDDPDGSGCWVNGTTGERRCQAARGDGPPTPGTNE